MAVDQIARMMAMDAAQQGGGTGDAYTKAETDELLDGKADLVDGKVPAAQLPSYTVDQTFDPTSANAQSGVAVAGALANKPGEITTGKQYTIDGQTVTAGTGAEVFNALTNNKASGMFSHAEGVNTTAFGFGSHAEGASTKSSGDQSHSEGSNTTASGLCSHAEGQGTTASGAHSHAEGAGTIASGDQSHAEGSNATASGAHSHAEGLGAIASSDNQHAQGRFNVEDANDTYAFIIGNGTANNARHNAFAIDWNGLIYVNGAATGVDVSQLTPVTVDQTYDPTSENAQSGTAVAQAMVALLGDVHFEYLGKVVVPLSVTHFVGSDSDSKYILVYEGEVSPTNLVGYEWLKDHIVIGNSIIPNQFRCGMNKIFVRTLDYNSSSAGSEIRAPFYVFQGVE